MIFIIILRLLVFFKPNTRYSCFIDFTFILFQYIITYYNIPFIKLNNNIYGICKRMLNNYSIYSLSRRKSLITKALVFSQWLSNGKSYTLKINHFIISYIIISDFIIIEEIQIKNLSIFRSIMASFLRIDFILKIPKGKIH